MYIARWSGTPHAKIGKEMRAPIVGANAGHMVGIMEWAKKTPPDLPDGELLPVDQHNIT